jgi:peptide subunit release factor 1 (eRF1)
MLTYADLIALERSLRSEPILSVYLDGTAKDPATQRTWCIRLEQAIKDLRGWLSDSPRNEREQFEQCVKHLGDTLPPKHTPIGAPGWVTFIAHDGVRYSEHLPVPMPTLAVWSTGASIAPYIRALKQARPVIIVLVDAMKATVYRYHAGILDKLRTIETQAILHPPLHMGDLPRHGFHTGVRGETGRDANQRVLRDGTAHMLKEMTEYVAQQAGTDGWILTGGIPEVSKHAAASIAQVVPERVLSLDSLDIHATEAQIIAAAQKGASTLRDMMDLQHIQSIVEHANGSDLATLGPEATRLALGQARVRELYFTPRYLADHTADVEDAVRAAVDQKATVEQVSQEAAARLDAFGGIAARLRYALTPHS